MVSGTGTVTINDSVENYPSGSIAQIPQGAHHRMENKCDVPIIFIEVQYGSYFGEDDIVRVEDDYNRT